MGYLWLWVLLAAIATAVAFWCGKRTGWMKGWSDCEARDLLSRGYDSGWRDRGEFERKQGAVIRESKLATPAAPAEPAAPATPEGE